MKDFFIKLKTFAELIIAVGITYIAITYSMNFLVSILLIILAVFILFQALGNIDKINNYGPYNNNNSDSSDNNPYINQDKYKNKPHHNQHDSPDINVTVNTSNQPELNNDAPDYDMPDENLNNTPDDDDDFPYMPSNNNTDEEEIFINPNDFID